MNRKRLLRIARVVYLAAIVILLGLAIMSRRDEIVTLIEGTRPVMLIASLVLSFGMLAIASFFWATALGLLGSPVVYRNVMIATGRSVLARYIPGSVWYAVGRVTLLQRGGVAATPLATTAVLEVVLSLISALSLGAGLLGLAGALPGGSGWVVPAVAVLGGLTSPPVVQRIVRLLPDHHRDRLSMDWAGYGKLLAIMVMFWLWSAGVFAVYMKAFPSNDAFALTVVVGGFLLAWGVGFLAVIAPQGAGVFELTLASILVSQGVAEVAVLLAGYRVVTLIRDAIATGLAETYVQISVRRGTSSLPG